MKTIDFFAEYMDQYKMKVIPDFISRVAKEYYYIERFAGCNAMGWIIYNNMLDIPEGDRVLSVYTMLFEK